MSMNPKRPVSAILSAAMLLGMSSPPVQALDSSMTTTENVDSRLCSHHETHTKECGGLTGSCTFVCLEHTPQILPELDTDAENTPEDVPENTPVPPENSEQPDTPAAPSETIPATPLTPAQPSKETQADSPDAETTASMPTPRASDIVYTSATGGNHAHTGDGSYANPYNLFDDAVKNTMPGGTIIIKNKGFLNTLNETGSLPYIIDKDITIKSEDPNSPAMLQVRSGGIVLGGNVTIENVNLNFENKVHDAIFANGHILTLKNVLRSNGSREVDLFGGQLYEKGSNTPYAANQKGSNSQIIIEMNDPKLAPLSSIHLGNIYAGSMNGSFDGSVTIQVKDSNKGKNKFIGEVYASGAEEADPGNMLDIKEPAPPKANSQYATNGTVTFNLDSLPLRGSSTSPMLIDGTTGSSGGKANLTVSVSSPTTNLKLKDISSLTVKGNAIQPTEDSTHDFDSITIENGAELDLSKIPATTTKTLSGNGTLTLKKDGSLTITTTPFSDTLNFQTEGAWNGKSGLVVDGHSYITAPASSTGLFHFKANQAQSDWNLNKDESSGAVKWTTNKVSGSSDSLTPLKKFEIAEKDAHKTVNASYLIYSSDSSPNGNLIEFPLQVSPDETILDLGLYNFTYQINDMTISSDGDDESNISLYVTGDSGSPVLQVFPKEVKPFKPGDYKIVVSYPDESGRMLHAIAYLTVTEDPPVPPTNPQPNAENSIVTVTTSSSVKFGENINVTANIAKSNTRAADAISQNKAYLYINGNQVAEQTVSNSSIDFGSVNVLPEKHFKAGDNQIMVVYGGGTLDAAQLNGSTGTTNITVNKADATINLTNKTDITKTYDGVGVAYAPQATVTAPNLTISNPKFSVTYKKADGSPLDQPPVLPGTYKTEVHIAEGDTYKTTSVEGPNITIEKATPKVTLSHSFTSNNKVVLEATVQGVENGIVPTGTVSFSVGQNEESTKPEVQYGVAKLEIAKPQAGTHDIKATYKASTDSATIYNTDVSATSVLNIAPDHKPLTGITLNHQTLSMKKNTIANLDVTFQPQDASNQNVTWVSTNSAVATVEQNGQVTAKAVGTATIEARAAEGGHIASCVVTVSETDVAVSSVEINVPNPKMKVGQTDQLSAIIKPLNATDRDVTWTSNSDVVTVDSKTGKITANKTGSATITATVGGKTATCDITVTDTVAVDQIQLNTKTLKLQEKESATLTANITPNNASNQEITWESSDNDIVSIQKTSDIKTVKVIAHKKTDKPITVTAKSQADPQKTATCEVTVTDSIAPPTPSPTISITPDSLSLKVGDKGIFNANVTNGTSGTVTWTIEKGDEFITLNASNGEVTGKKAGTATVKATYTTQSGVSVSDTATVVVSETTPPAIPITDVQIVGGDTSLKTGAERTFTAKVLPATAPQTVTWSASPTGILSVDASTGKVTALKEGKAILTATSTVDSQKSGSITVTVADMPVTEVKITEAPLSLREGQGAQLTVKVSPADATNRDVKWESDDTSVLSVTQDGYITAHNKGVATITVTSVAHPELKDSRMISVTASSSGGGSGGSGGSSGSGGGSNKPSKPDKKPDTKPETKPEIPPSVTPERPKPGVPIVNTAPPVNSAIDTDFADIPQTHWASEPIQDVVSRGLFVGTAPNTFSPNESMSRSMVVTVLYRLAGEPAVQAVNQFSDVGRTYYTDAVTWASENQIVSGTSKNIFSPNLMVTREELIVMLHRLANPVPDTNGKLTGFSDTTKVSSWASASMQWAVENEILKGSDGALLPQQKLTRAEAASLISRFTDKILTQ